MQLPALWTVSSECNMKDWFYSKKIILKREQLPDNNR
jgi:hypothetical protein